MTMILSTKMAADARLVSDAYDRCAIYYDSWKWQTFWRHTEAIFVDKYLGIDQVTPNALLDVGCGTGWYLDRYAGRFAETVGIDNSAAMLAVSAKRNPGASVIVADARLLPFADQHFGAVLCTRVLSHLPDAGAALREICRVLHRDGILVLSDVHPAHDYICTRLPTKDGLFAVPTFKHDPGAIADIVADLGLRESASMLIYEDCGSDFTIQGAPARDTRPVGWATAWRFAT